MGQTSLIRSVYSPFTPLILDPAPVAFTLGPMLHTAVVLACLSSTSHAVWVLERASHAAHILDQLEWVAQIAE